MAEHSRQVTAWPQGLNITCTSASMQTMQASCSVAPPSPNKDAKEPSVRLCPGLLVGCGPAVIAWDEVASEQAFAWLGSVAVVAGRVCEC